MNATATYTFSKTTLRNMTFVQVVVDVESDLGWLGACALFAPTKTEAYELAYAEAERRAMARGLTLQTFKAAA